MLLDGAVVTPCFNLIKLNWVNLIRQPGPQKNTVKKDKAQNTKPISEKLPDIRGENITKSQESKFKAKNPNKIRPAKDVEVESTMCTGWSAAVVLWCVEQGFDDPLLLGDSSSSLTNGPSSAASYNARQSNPNLNFRSLNSDFWYILNHTKSYTAYRTGQYTVSKQLTLKFYSKRRHNDWKFLP